MRRGWRNDPAWIEHYRQRDERRAQREMCAAMREFEKTKLEMAMKTMREIYSVDKPEKVQES